MKILVVGTGSIGMRHLRNLMSVQDRFDLHLEAADPDADNRQNAKQLLNRKTYLSMEEALDDGSVDAVIVCSPNQHHIPQAKLALSRGCHMFIEKPLSVNLKEAEQFLSSDHDDRLIMIGCNLRFHCAVKSLRQAVHTGAIGRPLYANAHFAHYLPNWRPGSDYRKTYSAQKDKGGGILLDAVHEPDYLCWIFGKALNIQGRLMNLGDLGIDCEDTAIYSITHETGAITNVHVDYLRRDKSRGCVVVGTNGTVSWESKGKNPEQVLVKLYSAVRNEWVTLLDEPEYDPNTQYLDEMIFFLDAVTQEKKVMNDPVEAYHTMEVLDSVRSSSDSGNQVRVTTRGRK